MSPAAFFFFAGMPWRMGFARVYPITWAMMERSALNRHYWMFGDPHYSLVYPFYRGRLR